MTSTNWIRNLLYHCLIFPCWMKVKIISLLIKPRNPREIMKKKIKNFIYYLFFLCRLENAKIHRSAHLHSVN